MGFLNQKNDEDSMGTKTPTGIDQLLHSMNFLDQPVQQKPVSGMGQIDSFMGPPNLKSNGSGGGGGTDLSGIVKLLGPLLGL